ncbi:hypothetical protein BV22DRAFT_1013926 [Leucogyrophana mollusca]|uniref:Uncharacterized protein n=1 Tax=Leucogyrophana mollusca TaxID=85980 RepID=A0ACB8BF71_9AGAM|nr:hypothetical protein BV22DRAFT_1013926 [Leucogyrophana mollusca]
MPQKRANKSNFQAFLDFVYKLVLIGFAVYALSVCPQDEHLQSPVCRGLSAYKRIILDPYIIPPIQAALAHPSIAPHVERATPYVTRAVDITTPILLRTQYEWNLRVVPQWNKRIVPEWNKRVVPQWEKRATQAKLEPYRARVEHIYENRLAPQARRAAYNLQRWQYQAQPYIVLAVSKTQQGYYAAKPYAIPLAQRMVFALQQFLLFLQEQRQKFVDPHVATIWEKVKELSSRKQDGSDATPGSEAPPPSPSAPVSVLETIAVHSTLAETPLATPAHQASSFEPELVFDETVEKISAEDATTVAEFTEPTPDEFHSVTMVEAELTSSTASDSIPLEDLESASSVMSESVHPTPPSEPMSPPSESSPAAPLTETLESASSIMLESVYRTASIAPSLMSSAPEALSSTPSASDAGSPADPLPTAPPVANNHLRDDDEIDINAFYAELGLDEPLDSQSDAEEFVPPAPPAETDEERAERLRLKAEETAQKRADIQARHAKWEADLSAQMEGGKVQLENTLTALRTTAADDLQKSTEIRHSIEGLVADAEKYIKGAEVYLKNLKAEGRKQDEKQALWDRVVGKVGEKFEERLRETEGVVNAWYAVVRDQEMQEVAKVAAEVREIAEKAQVDLGLDYAWLDDVTYSDWQRYHALIETSERFTDEATSIQNGTHPSGSANPLTPIIEDLELEVQDVVIGFETRLRRIKRDGERAFSSTQKEEEKGSGTAPEPEPEVSILPIPETDARGETVNYIPPVVIGRGKDEVLEALGRLDSQGGVETGSVEPRSESEEVVESLVHEAEAEEEMRSSGASILHTEL